MEGIVLLEEDQQRALQAEQQQLTAETYTSNVRGDVLTSQRRIVVARTEPRTDFTTQHPAHGNPICRPSAATAITTATGDAPFASLRDDSYPILPREESSSSPTHASSHGDEGAAYAGTSSGLKISALHILLGLVAGLVVGVVMNYLKVSSLVVTWVALPGELFLRALKCIVVPYVFASVAVAVGDIVFVGKVSVIGVQTAKIFGVFWLASVAVGLGVALLFRPLFQISTRAQPPIISQALTCANGLDLAIQRDNSVACATNSTTDANSTAPAFLLHDINNVFTKSEQASLAHISLGDQLMQVVTSVVSNNILSSVATGDLLPVITFAMLLGAIAGRSFFTKSRRVNYLYLTLLQLRNTLFLMMDWTIWLSPVAVISLIAGSFAPQENLDLELHESGMYLLAGLCAVLFQLLVVMPVIVLVMTQCNPYTYMQQMTRAYVFAFACSSSVATTPVTLTCVKKSRACSQSLTNFVISIGVSSNITGMAIYLPIALVFLAETSGNGGDLTWLRILGIAVLSLVSCAGTPPIPAAGLVIISTTYTALFGQLPATFSYVMAADFVFDRLITVCSVNDDLMALKIVAENTDETVAQDQLGQRF